MTDATGCYRWPAGERFARDAVLLEKCRGLRVCDLGCGIGMLGEQALVRGAEQVTFADANPEALAQVQKRLSRQPESLSRAIFQLHVWGTEIPGGPFGIILGGDILYRPEFFADLLASISLSLDRKGCVLLADPRNTLESELPMLARDRGLQISQQRREDFTLLTMRFREVQEL